MRDLGLIDWDEPVSRLFTQGMVIRDGRKMSKNLGNVVSPRIWLRNTARIRPACSRCSPRRRIGDLDWQDEGVEGMWRFPPRVYRIVARNANGEVAASDEPGTRPIARPCANSTRRSGRVTHDFETRWHFKHSIASIMELTNELYDRESHLSAGVMQEVLQGLTRLLSHSRHIC